MNTTSVISPPLTVHRSEPEFITPAKPTPHEFKALSDLDDQDTLRIYIPVILLYPYNPAMEGVDPAKVIKEAVAKALVFYYPFAGRLREVGPSRKLIVECTGEGVLFIEAHADVTLQQSGNSLEPPFPDLEELLFYGSHFDDVLDSPLLLIQVTRLKCGGFVVAIGHNHTMADGSGLGQFLSAVGEIARGKQVPSILPVWERHLLCAATPPNLTGFHPEYENYLDVDNVELDDNDGDDIEGDVNGSFFFGPKELSTIRKLIPPNFQKCSTFEILTACIWKCRTISISPKPNQIMRMSCIVNARNRFNPPLIPQGYYGNSFLFSTVISKAEQVIRNPVEYALDLIRKAKEGVSRDYIQSAMDTIVSKERPWVQIDGTYMMSDNTRSGFREVDFGWGNAIYGGPPRAIPAMTSYYLSYENKKGENGIILLISLPAKAMERFEKELNNLLNVMPTNTIKCSL
ncbi:benzyl alcohol O-benzoyltransferase-like [Euphorbia lathyris]|uniref:benzyl alcohol O-benzoyltransferase-like n=1 Tax=Euphorbia lathyris TaxID=212925 RepID=UPI003313B33B